MWQISIISLLALLVLACGLAECQTQPEMASAAAVAEAEMTSGLLHRGSATDGYLTVDDGDDDNDVVMLDNEEDSDEEGDLEHADSKRAGLLHFGKRAGLLHFGKKRAGLLHFGKRAGLLHFGKKRAGLLHFGKRHQDDQTEFPMEGYHYDESDD